MERIIEIKALAVTASIGVPAEERATPQELLYDLRFASLSQPEELHDDLTSTVDYAAVYERLHQITHERPRLLIETLADEITKVLLMEFQLRWVELTIRKFILPHTEYVAVTVRRSN